MSNGKSDLVTYSLAFKKQVVDMIERGDYSKVEIARRFQLSPVSIYKWLRQLGRNDLIGKVVRIETMEERDRTKELEEKIKSLQKALSETQIKYLAMESIVEIASEHYGTDLKKNFGSKGLQTPKRKGKRKG